MLPILQLGPLALQLPGLLLLLGVWVASWMAERHAARHGVDAEALERMILISLLVGVVGARLGYALEHASVYLQHPAGLLSLNPSSLSAPAGLLLAGATALVYGQRRRLPLWPTLDALTPALASLAVFVGLAHAASGDAFGAVTEVPWAIELWGARRHPSQFYEVGIGLAVLGAVWALEKRQQFAGQLFLSWLALASATRLVLEAFRGDSLHLGGVRQAQLAALCLLLLSLAGLHLLARRHTKTLLDSGAPEA
jgi:phosphatidylglycerol:prolipoprotein diacylglycerol transferase